MEEDGGNMGKPHDPSMHAEFKIIRLPRNGPKPGQSTEAWLYGKEKHEKKMLEYERWKAVRDRNKKGA
jgi:hypothetical protein